MVVVISLCLVANPPAPVSPLGSPPRFELFRRRRAIAASPLLSGRIALVVVVIGGNASPFWRIAMLAVTGVYIGRDVIASYERAEDLRKIYVKSDLKRSCIWESKGSAFELHRHQIKLPPSLDPHPDRAKRKWHSWTSLPRANRSSHTFLNTSEREWSPAIV